MHADLIKKAQAGGKKSAKAYIAEVRLSALVYLLDGMFGGSPMSRDSFSLSRKVFASLSHYPSTLMTTV